MDTSMIAGSLSNASLDSNFDVTSALKGKYSDFMNVFADISKSMLDDTAMTFPDFPCMAKIKKSSFPRKF